MINYITSFLLLLFLTNPSVSEVRLSYKTAAASKEKATAFYDQLSSINNDHKNKVLVGYKAAALTIKAKYEKGIGNKKKYFKEGATLLEELIAKHPANIELRFIRFSIQENAPKIVGYNKHKNTDKSFIVNNLKSIKDIALKSYIKTYLLKSKAFTTAEKTVISEL